VVKAFDPVFSNIVRGEAPSQKLLLLQKSNIVIPSQYECSSKSGETATDDADFHVPVSLIYINGGMKKPPLIAPDRTHFLSNAFIRKYLNP
jgi:hypothetical protein